MVQSLEQWYYDIPLVTRVYLSILVLVSIACRLGIISPLNLYYSWFLVWRDKQWWRLATNFFYIDKEPFSFFISASIILQHGRILEEGYFRSRKADYVWFFLFSAVTSLVIATLISGTTAIFFLSPCISSVLVYVWSRVCSVQVSVFGIFLVPSCFIPWLAVSIEYFTNRGGIPVSSMIGVFLGHTYYYFDYIYPRIKGSGGKRLLKAPRYVRRLLSELEETT